MFQHYLRLLFISLLKMTPVTTRTVYLLVLKADKMVRLVYLVSYMVLQGL